MGRLCEGTPVTAGQSMSLLEWQQKADRERLSDELLGRGGWRGYLNLENMAGPVHGAFGLVRWSLPSVAVAHDDPDELFELARILEKAVGGEP